MKILSTEINLGSASNVSNASVIRLFNSGDSNILVTRKDYTGTVVGSFIVPAGQVIYAEKYFTDTLEGSADVKATKTAYSSMMSFEGSAADPLPTYTHSVSASSVDEGGSFTTTITTTNVDDGTNLYWELTGVVADDFSSGALTGTASISSNSATFSHTVDEDNLTEGSETATIKVYSDSGRTTQVGNTLTVTIVDTSTPPSEYAKLSTNNSDTKDAHQPTLSNNDLTAQSSTPNTTNWNHGRSTLGFTTGKWYWEVTASGEAMIGVEPISENIDREFFNGGTTAGLATRDGKVWFGGTLVVNSGNDWSDGDTIGVAFDADNGYMYIYVNGTLKYSYDSTMSSSVIKKPSYSVYDAGSGQQWTLSFNFGEGGFAQTPPSGYKAVDVANGAVKAGYAHSAHRYWRIQEGDHTNYQIHPRSARLGLIPTDNLSDITWLYTFTSDNCSDTGTYQNWTASTYDHGSPIAFTHYAISSVFNGSNYGMGGSASLRAGTYYVEYSDDGSSWTTAWAGVAHNSSQDGTGAEAIYPSTGEDITGNNTCFCGHGIMQGSRFGPDNPNDGTDWGSKWSNSGFDQSIDLAFDGYLRCGAYRARTGGNAVLITMSGVSITVNEYVKVYVEQNYPSTVTATIDGVTYTSAHTGNQVHTHTFRQTGTLTQLTVVNQGSGGRTYLEGIVVDGYLLKNNTTTNGWNY